LLFTRNYEWTFQRNYHLFLDNEILRKQNKILLELRDLKEQMKAMKESQEVILGYFQINENRPGIEKKFKSEKIGFVDGQKLFVESMEALNELENKLKDEDFFQRAVSLLIVKMCLSFIR